MARRIGATIEKTLADIAGVAAVDWRRAIIELTNSDREPVDWREALIEFINLDYPPIDWRIALEDKYGLPWQEAIILAFRAFSATYQAKSVHFNGGAYLHIDSLSAPDSDKFAMVFWFKTASTTPDQIQCWMANDVNDSASLNVEGNVSDGEYSNGIFQSLEDFEASKQFNINTSLHPSMDGWHCYIGGAETNFGTGEKRGKIYIDDVDVTSIVNDNNDAFSMVSNGREMYICTDGFGHSVIGDVADMRIMIGMSLLDGGGDIPLATRRLFIDGDGKPVNPSEATAQLGTPTILFSGDAASFITNQGSGGAFTLSGSLTDASTSPSDAVGGGYHAESVNFDGLTFLTNDSLIAPDTNKLTLVWWFKTAQDGQEATIFVIDPDDTVCPYFEFTNGRLDCEASAVPNTASIEQQTSATFNDGSWHCAIYSIDGSSVSAPRDKALYIDDVLVSSWAFNHDGSNGPAVMFGNGLKAQIGYDNTGPGGAFIGDLADLRVFYDVAIVNGNAISSDKRRLFIDANGKPVNPATAVATLGQATIQFCGNASTFGTNQGSGGAFVTTGSFTNATTSPSD